MSEEADPKNPEVIAILEIHSRAKAALDGGKYGDFFETTAPAWRLRTLNFMVLNAKGVAAKLGRAAEIKALLEKLGAPASVMGEAGETPEKRDERLKTAWSGVADVRGIFVALFEWLLKAGQPNTHAECFVGVPHVCSLTADRAKICLVPPGHVPGTPLPYCNVSKFDGRWYLYGP